MTELLHPAHTNPDLIMTSDEPGNVRSLTKFSAGRQAFDMSHTSHKHEHEHEHESTLLDEGLSPRDLAALSNRQLRVMVNQAFKLMDTDYPPVGAMDRYEMLIDELDHRVHQAAERGAVSQLKETFRDNPLYCRFELFSDGDLAGYVKYTMDGGQVILLDVVEQPAFRNQGIDSTLMRHVVLNAHKRRLSLVAQCPMALSFLADNPQYQVLTAHASR